MIRLTTSLLSEKNGKYFFQDQLFMGVAYHLVGSEITSIGVYEQGEFLTAYVNEYLPKTALPGIDSEYLEPENEDDYEPLMCFDGRLFSGLAYDFQNGICTGELLYSEGRLNSFVNYYFSGNPEAVELIDSRLMQRFHWHPNNTIKRFELYEKNFFEITLGFEETGEINCLSINGTYFERVSEIFNLLKLHMFTERNFVLQLKGAPRLYLQGSEITDELFIPLINNQALQATSTIHIAKTSLSNEAISRLTRLSSLKSLRIDSTTISPAVIKQIENTRKDWQIEFNDGRIET